VVNRIGDSDPLDVDCKAIGVLISEANELHIMDPPQFLDSPTMEIMEFKIDYL